MAWRPIVGRGFTAAEFKNYVAGLQLSGWRPSFVVVHNTSAPSAALYRQWQARPGWTGEQWLRNLESYYKGMGWQAGPHLFVASDKIWAFSPLTMPGTHSPAWNSRTWGVETIGEFESEPFSGGVRDNLISVLATLHSFAGLNPSDYSKGVRGLHFHKEDPVTTHKTCPGRNMVKADLVAAVEVAMQADNGGGHAHVPEASQSAPTAALPQVNLTSVSWLQQRLNAYGAALAVDGDLGPKTRAAVAAFQTAHGLVVDGIAGPVTRLALSKEP
ncbi:N-acetylmuramoyl-L-alanine amidase [Bradyrhizobium sp. 179]|uniref:peptidoglycan recognition protein family protein n=1 Tax=Bradyrhizobium sp. 179 TaxID=2782648 RepID=UPI001FF81F89|nr:N-acetylmuramoyl-L-alanine amidase [Bradyrhizobium sp. 179]MCK1543267.1 N-acetylmuramoyl-L-alanine amidase [Bradyrhizobium sp. 179]